MNNGPARLRKAIAKTLVPVAFAPVDIRTVSAKDKIRALELLIKLFDVDPDSIEGAARAEAARKARADVMKQVKEVMAHKDER